MNGIFNFFSGNRTTQTQGGDDCCICLLALQARAGVPVMTPGCCGKFFHQDCMDKVIASGSTTCPHCVQPLPARLLNTPQAQQMPVAAPQQVVRRSIKQPASKSLFSASSSGEDLLDAASLVAVKAASSAEVSEVARATVTLECFPEKEEISLSEDNNFYVNVNMKASEVVISGGRMPMDIVCVLDNSGSMQGSKIQSLKVAMEFIRSQLSGNDRLSVVTFNSTASTTHGLFRMNQEKKDRSQALCNAIAAGGGTSIYSGMQIAADILDNRQTTNKISCVFLLTDGQDSSNMIEKKRLGETMKAKGFSLFTFGFGADHDSAQLQMIANAAEGQFIYVEADDMVTDAFGGAIGGQQGTIATNFEMTLRLPEVAVAAGVRLLRASAGRYPTRTNPDGSIVVTFANLFSGEQRDVLTALHVPAVTAAVDAYPLLTASAQYTALNGERVLAVSSSAATAAAGASASSAAPMLVDSSDANHAHCVIRRSLTPSGTVNIAVDAQKVRVTALEALEVAMSNADRGDVAGGNRILQDCLMKLEASPAYAANAAQAMSSVEDITEAIEKTRSRQLYENMGGKSTLCEQMNNISGQRSAYSKPTKKCKAYQNVSSACMQQGASEFKSKKGFF